MVASHRSVPSFVCALAWTFSVGCESGARRERPAAASPDASVVAPAPVATPRASDEAPAEPRPCRVALVGDSLTEGRIGGGFVRYLVARSPKSRFENFAKGGAMVNQMKRQLDAFAAAPRGTFSHLVVWAGVNDLYSDETAGRTVAKIRTDLAALYAAGKQGGARVVGITVAPWGGFIRYFNARRGAATRELNEWILAGQGSGELAVVVDAYALLSCGDPEKLCPRFTLPKDDGLHVGKLGHEALGAALYEAEFHRCA